MLKKLMKFLIPLSLAVLMFVGVAARGSVPYMDTRSATKTWNAAYATMTTRASIVEGISVTYDGGSWSGHNPLGYSRSTTGPTNLGFVTSPNTIQVKGTVKFTFTGTTSPTYTVYTLHSK
jgi:hypothetical protein